MWKKVLSNFKGVGRGWDDTIREENVTGLHFKRRDKMSRMDRTELLFAHWATRALQNARGPKWKKLVQEISSLPETHPDALAFQLMMVRLNSCVNCDARKYVEKGGCARCSLTTLNFSRETEEALLARFRAARKEIAQALKEERRAAAKAA